MPLNNSQIHSILENLQNIVENEELEFKGAKGGLPGSFWETYSAFANTNGGVFILGIKERNGKFESAHLSLAEIDKLQKDLWSGLSNKNTINLNLLHNSDLKHLTIDGLNVLVIRVPRANRDQRPIHTGRDPYNGTYRRGYEGDFKCTPSEIQRMFADANITQTTDKRILKGYTFNDIDLESLHQYRRIFNVSKPDHAWSSLDDMTFLKQLGAYRYDRATREEGFTVAGILMFGKSDAITDDECLPNFFPDYRNETTIDGSERWIDRIYPDGTWETNLFQFYLRTLPRLQNFLPKPFQINGNLRVDQSPAHIAIREVFVNLCVHADYKAEGSLKVIFKNGTYIFSNPGTMLVSQEQFFEGGESICRNPTIQKMFMMLGPAEKAGSGGFKIMEGWRKNNWKEPLIFERTRPDKVEFWLSMQSLMQPEISDELTKRLGVDVKVLSEPAQTVLGLALTEEYITNERLRYVSRIHKSDITVLLKYLCQKGLLMSEGYGRGTRYKLAIRVSYTDINNIDSREQNVDSPSANIDSSLANVDSSSANVDSSSANVDSSSANVDSNIENFRSASAKYIPSDEALILLRKKRLSQTEMEKLIREITSEWRSIDELKNILGKEKSYIRNHILPIFISKGVLEREYPLILNHPNQRYKAK